MVLADLVEKLTGLPVRVLVPATGGGNNQLFKAVFTNGDEAAVKVYLGHGAHERLEAEFRGLDFLKQQGVSAVPRPIVADHAQGVAVYDWIDGAPVGRPTDADVTALADLLVGMQRGKADVALDDLALASAACPAPADVNTQFHARLKRLRDATSGETELQEFLSTRLEPCHAFLWETASVGFAVADIDPTRPLDWDGMALSPSDFGFHNALRKADGSLVFVDFEYFGWDDPVKAVSDICWHAGMELDDRHVALFLGRVTPFFAAADKCFSVRLKLLYPLLGLIWCLIMLNEFLPDRWQRRAAAGRGGDWQAAKARQLHRARLLLNRVEAFR